MKKLLLLAVLAAAGVAQAHEYCGERVQCEGSVRKGESFKCADCVCPEVKCPIPAEVVCEARAVPVKSTVCREQKQCGHCHKPRVHGCNHGGCCRGTGSCERYTESTMMTEPAAEAKTPKRMNNKGTMNKSKARMAE